MAITTKTGIQKLLSKGRLSGKEIGRLILQDSMAVDNGGEGFLSEKDITTLKASLRTPQDVQDYNNLIEAYRIVAYSMKEAAGHDMAVSLRLTRITNIVQQHLIAHLIDSKLEKVPAIMTEKQYQEAKATQRKTKLQRLYCIHEIISKRAFVLYRQELPEFKDIESYDTFVEEHPEVLDDLYETAEKQISKLIKAKKLKPIKLPKPADDKVWIDENNEWLVSNWSMSNADELDPEDREFLLSTGFSGEDLYQAGLEEWIERIETYTPGLFEGEYGSYAGVAVIQDPSHWIIDEKGHYKYNLHQELERISLLGLKKAEEEPDFADSLRHRVEEAIKMIQLFLALKQVTKEVSKATGVSFGASLNDFWSEIESAVQNYHNFTQLKHTEPDIDPELAKTMKHKPAWLQYGSAASLDLPEIKLQKLKPKAEDVRYYRDRYAMALGANWWRNSYWTPADSEGLEEDLEALEDEDGEPETEEVLDGR